MHKCTHMHMSPATYDHRNLGAQIQRPEEHGSKDSGLEQRRPGHRDSGSTGTQGAQGLREHRDSRAKEDRAQGLGSEGTQGAIGTKELGSIQ